MPRDLKTLLTPRCEPGTVTDLRRLYTSGPAGGIERPRIIPTDSGLVVDQLTPGQRRFRHGHPAVLAVLFVLAAAGMASIGGFPSPRGAMIGVAALGIGAISVVLLSWLHRQAESQRKRLGPWMELDRVLRVIGLPRLGLSVSMDEVNHLRCVVAPSRLDHVLNRTFGAELQLVCEPVAGACVLAVVPWISRRQVRVVQQLSGLAVYWIRVPLLGGQVNVTELGRDRGAARLTLDEYFRRVAAKPSTTQAETD